MYSIPTFNAPLSNKTFYKADQVQMFWNELGTNLLVLTQTDVDKTGKSYYGGRSSSSFEGSHHRLILCVRNQPVLPRRGR